MPSPEKVIQSVLKASSDTIAGNAGEVDKKRLFPRDNLQALVKAGAFGLLAPQGSGGAGGSLSALAQAAEAVGAACSSTAMVFLMHSLTAATLAAAGPEGALKQVLRKLASGRALGTLAFSESETGAHFYAPELRAVQSNGHASITGRKSFVTSGGQADFYMVLVQSESEGGADAYLIEKDTRGVRFEGKWQGLGMAGNSSIAMQMNDVQVDSKARVGPAGKAGELVFNVVAPFFLVGLAAVNVGIAGAALAAATDHAVNRRYPDGGSLAEIQYIQHRLADMDMTTRSARLLVAEAARLGESGDPAALVPIMEAKVAATEAAVSVTEDALRVTGGRGYTPALPVERLLRDARAGSIMAPTNSVLRNWIGKALTGLPVP